jgi:hypothetical protein
MRFTRPPTSFEWALAVYLVATLLVAVGVVEPASLEQSADSAGCHAGADIQVSEVNMSAR